MVKITALIRPHKLEEVKTAVADLGVSGMNVGDVRGCGNSPEVSTAFGGAASVVALPVKARLCVVAPDHLVERVIEEIVRHAGTGLPGDGKIFIERVEDVLRVRTGERGEPAL
jgi:nitrogen regulatory protein PII